MQIEKKVIDNFKPGKMIPKFQLSADFVGKTDDIDMFLVYLIGAKEPNNVFRIKAPVQGELF